MPYEAHPSAGELPPRDTQIWRFMSLTKFFSLVTTSSLYFSQAIRLREFDPFEGSLGAPNRLHLELLSTNDKAARRYLSLPDDQPIPDGFRRTYNPNTMSQLQTQNAQKTYVNCWHISEVESAFLWSTYATMEDGIAIRSTVGRLCDSVAGAAQPVIIGPVKYIDYKTTGIPMGNIFNAFFYKRASYLPERELRACVPRFFGAGGPGANPSGFAIPCDTDLLVEGVLVSPFSPEWCADVVRSVCHRYDKAFKIEKSSIMDPAIM